jgi:hypothetical protein
MKSLKCKTLAAILGIAWLGWLSTGCSDYNQWKDPAKSKTVVVYSSSTGEVVTEYKSMGIVGTSRGRSSFYDAATGSKITISGNHAIR